MSRSRRRNVCPTCGNGWRTWLRPRKGGRAYFSVPRSIRVERRWKSVDGKDFKYATFVRPPSVQALRCHWPQPYRFFFMCPDPWHKDHYSDVLNPKQDQSRRTTPARPASERPGRADVERRQRARAERHKARQDKARR